MHAFLVSTQTLLLLASFVTVGLAFWLLAQQHSVRRWLLLYAVMVLYLLFSGVYLVAHRLTGRGIDISVVYHLQTGLAGTGWLDFAPVLAGAAVWLVVSLVLPAWLLRRLRARRAGAASHMRHWLLAVALLGTGWAAHPGVHDLRQLSAVFFHPDSTQSDPFFTAINTGSVVASSPPRDLVWIYLESLERSYLDPQRFPGLTPNLSAIEREALSFTNLQQVEGTGWTIAGMVASQCGVPLLTLADGNALTGADRFMSKATCLGDLLKTQGHHLQFLGGASLVFAGKGAFYRTHGFEPQGQEEISPLLPQGTPVTDWGLYDDTLYAHAWQQLVQQAQQDAPLGMLMLTLDTHHPKGHPSAACNKMPYGDARNPMLNAVHCADMLVGRFVRQLQQHPRLKDALIVISSDHLAMPNTATSLLEQGPRRNLLLMLNSDKPPQQIDRSGTLLDAAPTVLKQMGLNVASLGYGQDLLGDQATLSESLSSSINDFLLSRIPVLRQLWQHPDLSQGLHWQTNQLWLDGRRLPLPLMFQLDPSDRISSVAYASERSLASLVAELPPSQNMLWVDECALLQGLNGQSQSLSGWCIAVGQAGARWEVSAALPDQVLEHSTLRQSLTQSRLQPTDAALQETRARQVSLWVQWGSLQFDHTLAVKGLLKPLFLRSSGHPSAASYWLAQGQAPDQNLVRGLTLLNVRAHGELEKTAHRDTCAENPEQAVQDPQVPPLQTLRQAMTPQANGLYVLMAHDSAVCGPSTLPDMAQGAPLTQAAQLGFRQPYIGLWLPDGQVHEYTAASGQTLTLLLTPEEPSN